VKAPTADGRFEVRLDAILGWSLFLVMLYVVWRASSHPRVRDSAAWRAYADLETWRVVGAIVLLTLFALIAWGVLR
jgi:hypothetical protein